MPRLYDCLLLARSMREDVTLPGYFTFYADNHSVGDGGSSLSSFFTSGYFGKIYVDDEHQEILFVHRSTTLSSPQKHESSVLTALANLGSDSKIYSQRLPKATEVALNFVKSQLETLLSRYSDYTCVQVGHSLGGFHAHICGYVLKHRVVAIDPPGAHEVITRLDDEFDAAQCEQHHSFFMTKNFINETNSHVGKLAYYAQQAHRELAFTFDESARTLETHSLDFFMAHIPQDAPDPITSLAEGFSWHQPSIQISSTMYPPTAKKNVGQPTCLIL